MANTKSPTLSESLCTTNIHPVEVALKSLKQLGEKPKYTQTAKSMVLSERSRAAIKAPLVMQGWDSILATIPHP
jgi:hypothetical protein